MNYPRVKLLPEGRKKSNKIEVHLDDLADITQEEDGLYVDGYSFARRNVLELEGKAVYLPYSFDYVIAKDSGGITVLLAFRHKEE